MRTLLLGLAGVLTAVAVAWVRRHRWRLRELAAAADQRAALLARLARGEPLPAGVVLRFPGEHPATGAPEPPVEREAFLAALAAGPYRYPSTVVGYAPRDAGLWDPPTAQQTYVLATGQQVDVLTRRRGGGGTWRS